MSFCRKRLYYKKFCHSELDLRILKFLFKENMYIFELLTKWINKKYVPPKRNFDPFAQDEIDEDCEHIFLPIDSTGEVLACSKCGLVVNKSDLKDKNIFKRTKNA